VIAMRAVGSTLGTWLKGSCQGVVLYQRSHSSEEEGDYWNCVTCYCDVFLNV